jgi:hypothetical protein
MGVGLSLGLEASDVGAEGKRWSEKERGTVKEL